MSTESTGKLAGNRMGAQTVILSRDGTPRSVQLQKYKVLIVSGTDQGREVVMDKDAFTIGAGPGNDLIIQDPAASRRHCEIRVLPEGFRIRDLQSTNGTILHGVRICEAFLGPGTEFQVGTTRVVFCPLQETVSYPLSAREKFGRLLGRSVAMRRVFHMAETFAAADVAVLIQGETGTGKELLAEAIHEHSRRKAKSFAVIDCGSLAKGVLESELFGHMRGAYTGATAERAGAFEQADGGTVFLDEIGELELDMQPKLLRVLEKKQVKRLGSNTVRDVDVRIVTATHRNVDREVNEGRFREDLFYRLSVVKIELPPLRQRRDDLPLLTRHFLEELGGAGAAERVADFDRAMEIFQQYEWPGNVRELRNVVELAVSAGTGKPDLLAWLGLGRMRGEPAPASLPGVTADKPFKDVKGRLVNQFEQEYVKSLLERHGGNVSKASREAQIERAYLQRLMRKHGISR